MRRFHCGWLVLAWALHACDGSSERRAAPPPPPLPVPAPGGGAIEVSAPLPNVPAPPRAPAQAEGGYRLHGVVDPHFDNMVAFALKVPRDYQVKQSFTRRFKGAIPQNQIYLSLRAPDGSVHIEYFPSREYSYSSGPLTESVRAQARALGLPPPRAPDELAPMSPLAYLRQIALAELARQGIVLRDVHNPKEAPPEQRGQAMETRGSLDGVLPNGHRARVECRIHVQSEHLNGETYYAWTAIPSVTQTSGDLEAAYAHTRVAQESIVRNPAWLERLRGEQTRGQAANTAASRAQHEQTMAQINANTQAMQAAHAQRMRDIKAQGEANTARFQERMAAMDQDHAAFRERMGAQDRQHEAFVDTIRGVHKYEDPTTGARVKVEDGHRHVYTDGKGHYLGSDTPIQAAAVDWQELRRLSLGEY